MSITVNDFVNAIADKLKKLYPDYDVYADEIKQEEQEELKKTLTNYFFIYVIDITKNQELGTRCQRVYNFDIFYFQPENENINFFNWTETMMLEFKCLKVGDDLYHVTDIEFTKDDDVGHFTFEIKFYTIEIQPKDNMETLVLKNEVK